MKDLLDKLLILRTPKIGPAKYADLLKQFGSVGAVVDFLKPTPDARDAVMREIDRANDLEIHFVSDDDDLYPDALRKFKNHPPVITARGNLNTLKKKSISIVGTRHATANGMNFVADIAHRFAENDFAVVSGMAIGTDTAAHRGALRANADSVTIAVLAGGVDYIWPLENESMYYEILQRGVVISEMPVGFVPITTNFAQRNRIVAGMSDKLILGEADMKSGSMITARFAIDLNREVWAIPSHPSDARAKGPNSLIQSGNAKLCVGISDFFDCEDKTKCVKKISEKNESENCLIDALGTIPVSESVLAQVVKKTVSEIKAQLVVLELQGIVRKVDGGYICV